jgi:L-serine dehydratase
MVLMATDNQGDVVLQETYYSVGGGFALSKVEMDMSPPETSLRSVPYISKKAKEMLQMSETSGKSIPQTKPELSRKRNQKMN